MKKLLFVTLEYPPMRGGVAEYLHGLKTALPEGSAEVMTVTLPKGRFGWLTLLPAVWKRMEETRADMLAVSHVLPIGYLALLTKWLKGKPYIVFVHGTDLKAAASVPRRKTWAARILKNAAVVVANSDYTRRLALDFGIAREKTEVVYPCPSIAPDAAAAEDVRKKRGLEGRRVMLSVARLVPRKGIDRVLRVMPNLKEAVEDVLYVIVGDGPEAKALRDLAAELEIADAVLFAGPVERAELSGWYGNAELFILPGTELPQDVEGFGLAFLEAAAHGVVSIAGRAGGAPEAVLNGETGWLVNPDAPDDLFKAVTRVMGDRDEARRMGEAARKRAREEFAWPKQAAKLLKRLS